MDPATSSRNDVRSLLRHIHEPGRLRGNPFVERLGGSPLRLVVEAAVNRLPWRARTILTRCDLGGELNRVVACDLGICLRQFYRERSMAFRLLAELLSNDHVNTIVSTLVVEPDLVRTFLGYAAALENAGHFQEAVSQLEQLSSDELHGEPRARVECRLVSLCCDYGDRDRARTHLAILNAIIDTLPIDVPDHAMLFIEAKAARAQLCYLEGAFTKAREIAEDALMKLRTVDRTAFRERHSQGSATVLLLLARLCSYAGEFKRGLSAASEARATLECGDMSHTRLFVESLAMSATIRVFTPRGLSAAIIESAQALEAAQRLGLARQCANVANNLAGVYLFRGKLDRAAAFAREAIKVGRLVCSQEEILTFCGNFATIQVSRGDTVLAREALADSREFGVSKNAFIGHVLQLPAAEVLLLENEFSLALAAAKKVTDAMRAIGNARFLGSALRIEAEAHNGLGNSKHATRAIRESVELLLHHPHPYALYRSYASASRLTGRAAYTRAAEDLMGELRAS